jgi:hypothetical protein
MIFILVITIVVVCILYIMIYEPYTFKFAKPTNVLPISQFPPAPNPTKPVSFKIGGKTVIGLLQYKNGPQNFRVGNDGRSLQASINPSSYDGSKKGKSQHRLRNEVAIRNEVKKTGQTIGFNFRAQGVNNLNKNKSAIFFQLKPQGGGGNDSLVRLGIKNGFISYGLHGNDTIATNIPASQKNAIQITSKNGRGYLNINGTPITNKAGEPISFSLGAANSTQIKFGLEGLNNAVHGEVQGSYDNISF